MSILGQLRLLKLLLTSEEAKAFLKNVKKGAVQKIGHAALKSGRSDLMENINILSAAEEFSNQATQRLFDSAAVKDLKAFFLSVKELWCCRHCNTTNANQRMIQCDKCQFWFHFVCIGLKRSPSEDREWICPPFKQ